MISHTARGPVDTSPMQPGRTPEAQKPAPVTAAGSRQDRNTTQTLPDAPTEAVKHL
jgi:hypothetical protein